MSCPQSVFSFLVKLMATAGSAVFYSLYCLQPNQQCCPEFHAEQTPLREVDGSSRGPQPQLCAPKRKLVIRAPAPAWHPRHPLHTGGQPRSCSATKKKTTASTACTVIYVMSCLNDGGRCICLSYYKGIAVLGRKWCFGSVHLESQWVKVGVWFKWAAVLHFSGRSGQC